MKSQLLRKSFPCSYLHGGGFIPRPSIPHLVRPWSGRTHWYLSSIKKISLALLASSLYTKQTSVPKSQGKRSSLIFLLLFLHLNLPQPNRLMQASWVQALLFISRTPPQFLLWSLPRSHPLFTLNTTHLTCLTFAPWKTISELLLQGLTSQVILFLLRPHPCHLIPLLPLLLFIRFLYLLHPRKLSTHQLSPLSKFQFPLLFSCLIGPSLSLFLSLQPRIPMLLWLLTPYP